MRAVRQRRREAGHAVGEVVAEIDEWGHGPTFPALPSPRRFLTVAEYPISADRRAADMRPIRPREASDSFDGRRFVSNDAQDQSYDWRRTLGAWWADLQVAAAFLTRLPIRPREESGMAALADAARCFPIVGFGVGLLGGLAYALAIALDLPPLLAAIIAVAATAMVTGALHEDGLADTVDGFGGGGDRDRKLAIMRDSRIGTYGVIVLVLALGARVVALASFEDNADAIAALILGQAASRALVVAVMRRAPLARSDGLAASAGQPTPATMWWALGIGGLIAVALAGLDGVVAAAVGAAVAWAVAWLAQRQIGGVTGDVLGAVQQGSEIAVLLALVALD